eukprot:356693-Chlamydomonas_euryale.AAC.3
MPNPGCGAVAYCAAVAAGSGDSATTGVRVGALAQADGLASTRTPPCVDRVLASCHGRAVKLARRHARDHCAFNQRKRKLRCVDGEAGRAGGNAGGAAGGRQRRCAWRRERLPEGPHPLLACAAA